MNLFGRPYRLRSSILFALIVGAITVGSARGKTLSLDSPWRSAPIAIDGAAVDWRNLPLVTIDDKTISVGVVSDSTNLYLFVRTPDLSSAMAIAHGGLTLFLDPQGKKSEDFYLCLRTAQRLRPMRQAARDHDPGPRGGPDPEGESPLPDDLRPRRPELLCYQKRLMNEPVPIDMKGGDGPSVAFDTASGFFNYEFSVPLQKVSPTHYDLGVSAGRTIGVGLKWGGMMRDRKMRKGGMQGDFGGISIGGPGQGGMPGRGEGAGFPRGGFRDQGAKEQKLWLKVRLAAAPSR